MTGVKGQKNPSRHKRVNGWASGALESFRAPETFAFRPLKEHIDRIKAEMSDKGLNKQQWCDTVVATYFEEDRKTENPTLNPLVQDAIRLAIATKEAAIRSEQKKKQRSNQELIEAWQKEIESLEIYL